MKEREARDDFKKATAEVERRQQLWRQQNQGEDEGGSDAR